MCVFTSLVLNEELVDMVTFVSLRYFFFFSYTRNWLTWFQMCVFTSLFLNEELGDMVSFVCLCFLFLHEELVDMVSDVCLHFLGLKRGTR